MSATVCVSTSLLAAVDSTYRFVRTLGLLWALALGVPLKGVTLGEVPPPNDLHAGMHCVCQVNSERQVAKVYTLVITWHKGGEVYTLHDSEKYSSLEKSK